MSFSIVVVFRARSRVSCRRPRTKSAVSCAQCGPDDAQRSYAGVSRNIVTTAFCGSGSQTSHAWIETRRWQSRYS